jgi:hypothetical protein
MFSNRTQGSSRVAARLAVGGIAVFLMGVATLSTVGAAAADASSASGPYKVVSTTGLTERSAPSGASAKAGSLTDGTTVYIDCQAGGVPYATGGSPSSDDIWDELTNGTFVADYWINTKGIGKFSLGIPRCGIAQVSVWNSDFSQGSYVYVCGTNQENKSDCTPVYADAEGHNEYFSDYWFKGPVTIWAGNGIYIGISGCAVPAGYSSSVYTCEI